MSGCKAIWTEAHIRDLKDESSSLGGYVIYPVAESLHPAKAFMIRYTIRPNKIRNSATIQALQQVDDCQP